MRRLYKVENYKLDLSRYDNRNYVKKWVEIYDGNPYWAKSKQIVPSKIAPSIVETLSSGILMDMESNVTGGPRSEYVDKQYQNFLKQKMTMVELLIVQGSLILKPFIYRDRIGVELIPATNFIPIKFDDMGELVDVVFVEHLKKGSEIFTRLERHEFDFDKGSYLITNKAYKGGGVDYSGNLSNQMPLNLIQEWADLEEEVYVESGAKRTLFTYMKTPYTNISNVNSMLGISLLDKISEDLQDYDITYNDLMWEIEGKKLSVGLADAITVDPSTGKVRSEYTNKGRRGTLYRQLSSVPNSTMKEMIDVYSPEMRIGSYLEGLQAILRSIESSSGLAFGDLSEVSEVAKTATQIIATKNRRVATIRRYQDETLRPALESIVKIFFDLVEIYDLVEKKEHEEYTFTLEFGRGVAEEVVFERSSKPTPLS